MGTRKPSVSTIKATIDELYACYWQLSEMQDRLAEGWDDRLEQEPCKPSMSLKLGSWSVRGAYEAIRMAKKKVIQRIHWEVTAYYEYKQALAGGYTPRF